MKEEYQIEVNRKNFVRALYLAKELKLPEEVIQDIAQKALWQMAGTGRNFYAVKRLAKELGYSKEDLKRILTDMIQNEEKSGNTKMLGPCYEYISGKYLSFDKWLQYLLKEWNKINS